MPAAETRVLDRAPGSLGSLLKAALPALPGAGLVPGLGRSGDELPDLTLVQHGVAVDRGRVAAYAEVCGFPAKDALPIPYPHVVAFPLHLALMTDATFPFPAIGTVHLENSITQRRPLSAADRLDVRVWPERLRAHARGRVYDVRTEISTAGDVVWEERATFLVRGRGDEAASGGLEVEQVPPSGQTWRLPGDLGRRYARASGDRNPIHLYAVTARALGFPRQIAHGMWSLGRCVGALENRLPEAVTVEVAFKKPILLPGTVAFGSRIVDGGALFSLSSPKSGAPHLVGRATSGV